MNSDVEMLLELPDKYLRSESSSERPWSTCRQHARASTATGRSEAHARQRWRGGGGMVIRMGGPGGPIAGRREADARTAGADEQDDGARSAAGSVAADARLVRAWRIPSINAHYTYAGEAESPDGKADVIDVKGADGFAARALHRRADAPAADGHLQGTAAADHDRRAAGRAGHAGGGSAQSVDAAR